VRLGVAAPPTSPEVQRGAVGLIEFRGRNGVHPASARLIADDLAALVTYDHRMPVAAGESGLPVLAPGAGAG
jgi:hypothetical protein